MKTDTRLLIADDWNDYALLDSGHLQKLERFGSQTVIRPDPQAFWEPARPVSSWRADARFSTKSQDDDGAGNWEVLSPNARDSWPM
ncbi:MAG TPA: SAM-dependent methyltransferase, partial [Hyphomonas atlantica]|nr:SAM-dependent methyltransferase [Hyphomonas atlantica]